MSDSAYKPLPERAKKNLLLADIDYLWNDLERRGHPKTTSAREITSQQLSSLASAFTSVESERWIKPFTPQTEEYEEANLTHVEDIDPGDFKASPSAFETREIKLQPVLDLFDDIKLMSHKFVTGDYDYSTLQFTGDQMSWQGLYVFGSYKYWTITYPRQLVREKYTLSGGYSTFRVDGPDRTRGVQLSVGLFDTKDADTKVYSGRFWKKLQITNGVIAIQAQDINAMVDATLMHYGLSREIPDPDRDKSHSLTASFEPVFIQDDF